MKRLCKSNTKHIDFYNYKHFVQISPSMIDIEFKKINFQFYILKSVKIYKGSCEGEIM